MKSIIVLLTLIGCFTLRAEENRDYRLLSERRPELEIPSLSLKQKQTVLNQARLVLSSLYVHLDLKLEHFGNDINPNPSLDKIEKKLEVLTDEQFHLRMGSIFRKLNDLHTWYALPKPYACYRNLLPISFKSAVDDSGQNVFSVFNMTEKEDILKLVGPIPVKLGDVLVKYNGTPVNEVIETLKPITSGSNPDAVTRIAADLLSFQSQAYHLVPESNSVTLTFKNKQGTFYDWEVPWISMAKLDCINPKEKENDSGEDDIRKEMNQIFRKHKTNSNKNLQGDENLLVDTAEPTLKYGIIRNEYGKFGYIRLESFIPEKLSEDDVVLEVKKILLEKLNLTDGLIFDVRDNGGGYINLAENLVQLFTPKNPLPLNFKTLATEATLHYFKYLENGGVYFKNAIQSALDKNKKYANPLPINSVFGMNNIAQYYFAPVAVFTNAYCYSSCDMFSAQMQDHAAAIIVGEASTTGAGGANNVNLASIFSNLPTDQKGPFKKLPLGMNIGFSLRQTLRIGLNEGKTIEDTGVISDLIVQPRPDDFRLDSSLQFKAIGKKLFEMSSSMTARVQLEEKPLIDTLKDEPFWLKILWNHTDEIQFKQNDEILDQQKINWSGNKYFKINNVDTSIYALDNLEIIGLFEGKRVWRKSVYYRTVPSSIQVELNKPLEINFQNQMIAPLVVYNKDIDLHEGWFPRNGVLKTAYDKEYSNDVDTVASLFLNLPATPVVLSFDAKIQTEKDYDFFSVLAVSDEKEIYLQKNLSGQIDMKKYQSDLSAYAGKKIEIRFKFKSDGGKVDEGVFLDNIQINKQP